MWFVSCAYFFLLHLVLKVIEGKKERDIVHPNLRSMEQALHEVVSSKQCIWKLWLLAEALSGHMLDLETRTQNCP